MSENKKLKSENSHLNETAKILNEENHKLKIELNILSQEQMANYIKIKGLASTDNEKIISDLISMANIANNSLDKTEIVIID